MTFVQRLASIFLLAFAASAAVGKGIDAHSNWKGSSDKPTGVYSTISDKTGSDEAVLASLSDSDNVVIDRITDLDSKDEPASKPDSEESVPEAATEEVVPIATTMPARKPNMLRQASLTTPWTGPVTEPTCASGGVCDSVDASCGLPDASCGIPGISGLTDCDTGSCDDCGGCGQISCGALCTRKCPTCCGVGTHYSRFYGDVLYLRARKAEVPYAVAADGPIAAGAIPTQVGRLGIVDSDYELGFRAGLNIALDTVSSLDVRYTLFESETEDETSAVAPFIVRSMVSHPSTPNAASDVLSSVARLEVDFDVIDLSYRHLWKCNELFAANYVIGARYAKLEQQFDVNFVKNVDETVATDIDFDGAGMRLGLETQRFSCRNQLHVYANGYASFLAGQFRANYFQGNNFDAEEVNTEWEAGRIVPILDFEAGVGWSSPNNKLNLTAGYMVSAWFNSVRTQDFINAVQTNNYLDLCDSIWFDGLQARVSFCF